MSCLLICSLTHQLGGLIFNRFVYVYFFILCYLINIFGLFFLLIFKNRITYFGEKYKYFDIPNRRKMTAPLLHETFETIHLKLCRKFINRRSKYIIVGISFFVFFFAGQNLCKFHSISCLNIMLLFRVFDACLLFNFTLFYFFKMSQLAKQK